MGKHTVYPQKFLKLMIIAGLIVVLDQLTKAAILQSMALHDSIPVIKGFFSITHIQNPGGAFGLFAHQSEGLRRLFFIFLSSAAMVAVLFFYIQTPRTHPLLAAGFALIFGGAIGNLIDRFRYGKVVDFLDFYLGELHWPAFNIADSAISVGIAVLVMHLLFNKMPE
jgi:signal peptidase II